MTYLFIYLFDLSCVLLGMAKYVGYVTNGHKMSWEGTIGTALALCASLLRVTRPSAVGVCVCEMHTLATLL